MGLVKTSQVERIRALYRAAGLPDTAPALGAEKYMDYMGLDKKVEGGRIRFVLLRGIGEAFVSADVPEADLTAALTHYVHAI
jgi:3-dehydroquinate synthase